MTDKEFRELGTELFEQIFKKHKSIIIKDHWKNNITFKEWLEWSLDEIYWSKQEDGDPW